MRTSAKGRVVFGLVGGAMATTSAFARAPETRVEAIAARTYRMTIVMPAGSSVEDGVKALTPDIHKACPKSYRTNPELLASGPKGVVVAATVQCGESPILPPPPAGAENLAFVQQSPNVEPIESYRLTLRVPAGTTVGDATKLLKPTFSQLCGQRGYKYQTDVSEGLGPQLATATVECQAYPPLPVPPVEMARTIPPLPVPPVAAESHDVGTVYSVGTDSFQITVPAYPKLRQIVPFKAETPLLKAGAPLNHDQLKPGMIVDVYRRRGAVVHVTINTP